MVGMSSEVKIKLQNLAWISKINVSKEVTMNEISGIVRKRDR
jgi:hypothetical protein